MYYFPYALYFANFFSFTHHRGVDERDMTARGRTELWTIRRRRAGKHPGPTTFTAAYNHTTQNYEFDGKRYLSYDELVADAFRV